MRSIFLVKDLHCKFICVEGEFRRFWSSLCKQFSEDQFPWTKMSYSGDKLLRNWQLVINSTVHLLRLLPIWSLRSLNFFCSDPSGRRQPLVASFRTNLSRDFLAAMAAARELQYNETFVLRGAFSTLLFWQRKLVVFDKYWCISLDNIS